MSGLPEGTVSFLFTDIEGSTRLVQRIGDERFGELLEAHHAAMRGAVVAHGGAGFPASDFGALIAGIPGLRREFEGVAELRARRHDTAAQRPTGGPAECKVDTLLGP